MIDLTSLTMVGGATGIFLLLILAVIVLKGFALFKSARQNEKVWFWVMLLLQTFGILPLIYLIINKDKKGVKK